MEGEIKQSLESLDRGEEQIAALEKSFAAARQAAWEARAAYRTSVSARRKDSNARWRRRAAAWGCPKPVFEVRFLDSRTIEPTQPPFFIGGKKLDRAWAWTKSNFTFRSNPGEPRQSRSPKSPPAAKLSALDVGDQVAGSDRRWESRPCSSMKSMRVSAERLPKSSAKSSSRSRPRTKSSASPICRRSPPWPTAHFVVQKEVEKGRTFTRRQQASEKASGRRSRAYVGRYQDHRTDSTPCRRNGSRQIAVDGELMRIGFVERIAGRVRLWFDFFSAFLTLTLTFHSFLPVVGP